MYCLYVRKRFLLPVFQRIFYSTSNAYKYQNIFQRCARGYFGWFVGDGVDVATWVKKLALRL